jgi:hypothetical protein
MIPPIVRVLVTVITPVSFASLAGADIKIAW